MLRQTHPPGDLRAPEFGRIDLGIATMLRDNVGVRVTTPGHPLMRGSHRFHPETFAARKGLNGQ
jgi:hypothetical protein